MRKITSIIPSEDFYLIAKFDNGVEKKFDFKPYLLLPVFSILKDKLAFQDIKNQKYFIEWPKQELDLSADTLWHEGI